MNILAFETSCDETAVAIVKSGQIILSSNVISQSCIHAKYGGVIPEIASRNHLDNIYHLTNKTLKESNLNYNEIDAVSSTCAPGLIGSLIVGVNFAKSLAYSLNVPFIPVHHLKGHIAANYITHNKLKPPFLSLIISGGHTLLVKVDTFTSMKIIGQTHDDAVGEVFDKLARKLNLGYPGGPLIDQLVINDYNINYKLPNPKIKNFPLDFSFSGLKTALMILIEKLGFTLDKTAICTSFNKKVSEILIDRMLKASQIYNIKKFVLCGGVAANSMIRNDFKKIINKEIYFPKKKLCSDNAAMIASQAYYEYLNNNKIKNNIYQNAYSTMSINEEFVN